MVFALAVIANMKKNVRNNDMLLGQTYDKSHQIIWMFNIFRHYLKPSVFEYLAVMRYVSGNMPWQEKNTYTSDYRKKTCRTQVARRESGLRLHSGSTLTMFMEYVQSIYQIVHSIVGRVRKKRKKNLRRTSAIQNVRVHVRKVRTLLDLAKIIKYSNTSLSRTPFSRNLANPDTFWPPENQTQVIFTPVSRNLANPDTFWPPEVFALTSYYCRRIPEVPQCNRLLLHIRSSPFLTNMYHHFFWIYFVVHFLTINRFVACSHVGPSGAPKSNPIILG